ncbi:cob(I)yrinic acid a,c-diamide adenosyltransferase [Mangrovibacillus cuniculi]|uniref:Corrinoid adenosyltransferase n=1 Tax=Mangrovibacillus cuniculi TaxID=2593652 RepID=A0A7S8HEW5_9BACI|nr:cob(I)yrinic acid a,c-diamide adenosyltransferase [Mangrovibacillus cuniculi]QPC45479.1 cob(I)yrinic acid a,c-diamide adenosyltransferase [Mangrovibacillus cuniculi]QPC45800.1 cob(I)yrinic acid a,c-diamide adenosyltransferase [Mangrovibacillus cuniculi]
MKIYTKTGDKGQTSLIYGSRVAKNDLRVEAYGTCDEANSVIGVSLSFLDAVTFEGKEAFVESLQRVQTELFHVGAELATPQDKKVTWELKDQHISMLETELDKWEEALPPLRQFILPSGHPTGAQLHVARTIVRRAERIAVGIDGVNPLVLSYLNRLSDYLFVAARYVNLQLQKPETPLQIK